MPDPRLPAAIEEIAWIRQEYLLVENVITPDVVLRERGRLGWILAAIDRPSLGAAPTYVFRRPMMARPAEVQREQAPRFSSAAERARTRRRRVA